MVGAKIDIFDTNDVKFTAVIEKLNTNTRPFKRVTARLTSRKKRTIIPGDVGRWSFPHLCRWGQIL